MRKWAGKCEGPRPLVEIWPHYANRVAMSNSRFALAIEGQEVCCLNTGIIVTVGAWKRNTGKDQVDILKLSERHEILQREGVQVEPARLTKTNPRVSRSRLCSFLFKDAVSHSLQFCRVPYSQACCLVGLIACRGTPQCPVYEVPNNHASLANDMRKTFPADTLWKGDILKFNSLAPVSITDGPAVMLSLASSMVFVTKNIDSVTIFHAMDLPPA